MAGNAKNSSGLRESRWRMPAWAGAALLLLLLPLVAMQFTDEVNWGPDDFVVAGALLFGTGLTYELVAKKLDSIAYRAAVGIAVVTGLLLVWVNLAVGIIGDEDNPANLMYVGVLAIGLIGALIARFQPRGMAYALFATALAQMLVAGIVLLAGLDHSEHRPLEIVALHGVFAALFAGSGLLFRNAARRRPGRGAA